MTKNNVVALAGVSIVAQEPQIDKERAWAQLHEEMSALQDLNARMVQQLQDELDGCSARGEFRPDLQALIEESDRLCAICGGE